MSAGHCQLGVHGADFVFAEQEGRPHSGCRRRTCGTSTAQMTKAIFGRTPGSSINWSERGQSRGDTCSASLRIRRQREISLPQRGVSLSTVAFLGDPRSCSQGSLSPPLGVRAAPVCRLWPQRSRNSFSGVLIAPAAFAQGTGVCQATPRRRPSPVPRLTGRPSSSTLSRQACPAATADGPVPAWRGEWSYLCSVLPPANFPDFFAVYT